MVCKVNNCSNQHKAKGYCGKHYMRLLKHGDPLFVLKHYHGKTYTSEFKTWRNIKQRCTNPNQTGYVHYGGRGVKMCDRWLNSFENFYADMGKKPTAKHTIDRIDTNGDYEPSNCRWATYTQQNINRNYAKPNRSTGHKNIYIYRPKNCKVSKPYYVAIWRNCKVNHLGYFLTLKEAIAVRDKWLSSKENVYV